MSTKDNLPRPSLSEMEPCQRMRTSGHLCLSCKRYGPHSYLPCGGSCKIFNDWYPWDLPVRACSYYERR